MKFAYTICYVENVEETLSFFCNAFGMTQKFITPEKDYGELVTGETTLSFASLELGKSNVNRDLISHHSTKAPLAYELAFVSLQIEIDFERAIEHGAILVADVVEKPWGQKVGYVRDPNGILIEICTPISA